MKIYLDSVKITLYNLNGVKIKTRKTMDSIENSAVKNRNAGGRRMQEKPYHHGDLRNALIETGISLIHAEGMEKLSLRRVAALCGVSQAAPYAHFENKEALLTAMREYATARFTHALEEAVSAVPDPDDPKLLAEMGKRYVLFFLENPQYFHFIFSQQWMRIELDISADSGQDFPPYQLLKTNARRIYRRAGIPDEVIEDMVISMWASVHGLTYIATMQNVHYSKNWNEKIEDILLNQPHNCETR